MDVSVVFRLVRTIDVNSLGMFSHIRRGANQLRIRVLAITDTQAVAAGYLSAVLINASKESEL